MLNQGMMLMKGGNAYPKNRPIPRNQFTLADFRDNGETFEFSWVGTMNSLLKAVVLRMWLVLRRRTQGLKYG